LPLEPSENEYDLAKSSRVLGKLYPILKDAKGNIIDGFHRQNADPSWPFIIVDSVDDHVKLELARLAANYCRRTIAATEVENRIRFLIKSGLKPEEIAEATGIHPSTVYRHMPQELKDEAKAEAGRVGGSVRTCEQTVKTQDMLAEAEEKAHAALVECHECKMGTRSDQITIVGDKPYCPKHAPSAHIAYEKEKKRLEEPVKPASPKSLDTAEQKLARMHPQKSRMEEELLVAFGNDDLLRPVVTDRSYPIVSVTPDFVFPRHNLAVFLDGKEAHASRQERDSELREKLFPRHGLRVLSVPYCGNSDAEKQRIIKLVREAV